MLNAHTENQDGKNIAIIYCRDLSGCSHVRLRYNTEYINGHELGVIPVILPYYTFDAQYLARAKSIVFQRPVNKVDVDLITRYKELQPKFGFKLVGEFDDLIFRTGDADPSQDAVPPYNPSHDNIHKTLDEMTGYMRQTLPMLDLVTVSTPYLKKVMERVFHLSNVMVIKNVVPRFLWNFERKKNITEDLVKPRVIYSGSPTHYKQPIPKLAPGQNPNFPNGHPGQPGDRGDWNTALCDWVIKNVKEDKIDFHVMGSLPFFWEEIKEKIHYIPWADSHTFPRKFMEVHADFSIASIVDNPFNRAKSSLRFTEACACGCVFMGNVFTSNDDSPYREINEECKFTDKSTVEEIDNIFWKLCKKDKYNEILNWQYNFINNSGCWLESPQHLNEMMLMFDSKGENII
jgi:hypothetical protein